MYRTKQLLTGSNLFDIMNTILLSLLLVFTLYPFLNVIALSLNDATDSMKGGIYLLPRKFTLFNYQDLIRDSHIWHAGMISLLRTVIAVVSGVFLTAMVAYTISRKDYVLRSFITMAYVFTMYIDGGLIPTYFLIRDVGLVNNFAVYVLPGIVTAFNLLVIRTYIHSLPESLNESAKIDGAGDFRIFVQIIFPLCMPVLATIALFIAVSQWNAWFDTFLYASNNSNLSTLQYELMKILQSANQQVTGTMEQALQDASAGQTEHAVTPGSIRATMTVVSSLPIILVYPFLQRYFVKGLTLGGVKG
ncbi:carbohydrate ABC transporter permease [Paenibacillus qinlingensis]|uniref:carbohydrate ABC transporter permease n=1 Tax=Paenibacillus qinlingensis TaxID=1837343 RepID=UPI0015652176|nr:carbohydrate ABC transporter permease [Paenibacillus qinlingensis]NQX59767.1 carbohydrate ABC transporter permease [Paenibacillus qinlingensis]